MKYYIPMLQLGILSNPQVSIEDKFGGLPWGLPEVLWPICQSCKKSMSLIAQISHHSRRLDLRREGRCLFVFMCTNPDSMCDWTWDPGKGCNSSFIVEPEVLTNELSYPDGFDRNTAVIRNTENCAYTQRWDPQDTIWIETEARVQNWVEKEDRIPEQMYHKFMCERDHDNLDRDLLRGVYSGTKLGSVPCWLQYPEYNGWRFVGQLTDYHEFHGCLPNPSDVGCPISYGDVQNHYRCYPEAQKIESPREIAEGTSINGEPVWCCGGPNFGDGGMGYLFLKFEGNAIPESVFIWQCH